MKFDTLMKEVEKMFINWENDPEINNYYPTKEDLQKEMLNCVQNVINSDHVIMTKEELEKDRIDFHDSMEGTYYFPHK